MTNQNTPGEGTADPQAGATPNQPSEAEVTELRTQLATANITIGERDEAIVTHTTAIADLQVANKKFADEAAGLAGTSKQLTDALQAVEASRKTSADLTEKLELATTSNTTLTEAVTSRRRSDLVTKYSLTEEHVAGLDDAGLTVLENALPHVPVAASGNAPKPPVKPNGMGIGGGAGVTELADLDETQRALRIIERLKEPAS